MDGYNYSTVRRQSNYSLYFCVKIIEQITMPSIGIEKNNNLLYLS